MKVSDVMTHAPVTTNPEASLEKAANLRALRDNENIDRRVVRHTQSCGTGEFSW
jgi:hypothetical protein